MLRILNARPPIDDPSIVFEFRVARSPQDGETVLGRLVHGAVMEGQVIRFVGTPFSQPIAEAFLEALALAERHEAEAMWVNDPEGLFPPQARPIREITEGRQ